MFGVAIMSNYKIQYISYDIDEEFNGEGITLSTLDEPKSLDEFTVNVIDLSSEKIWSNKNYEIRVPDYIDEFEALNKMIQYSKSASVLIILPQNCDYKFNASEEKNGIYIYHDCTDIKRLIGTWFEEWISYLATLPNNILIYENTTSRINNLDYSAAFHFNNDFTYAIDTILTKSKISNKNTTVNINKVFFTTLEVNNNQELINFLDGIKLIQLQEKVPEWIINMDFFDDLNQKLLIKEKEDLIKQINETILNAQNCLVRNNRYKSILYTNGEELVTVVFEILEEMLKFDLSEFKDEKKEDFLIPLENVTFIGEIKGVTSNIKSEHISQLDVHYQGYMDKLVENAKNENVKAILIMDHQRTQDIKNRQPVHINQIKLAERNESLIVETTTLLKLFEKYVSGMINRDEIIELLATKTGLLEL
jgi:hypothetical protein